MKSFSKKLYRAKAPNVQQINTLLQLINSDQFSEALVLTQKMLEKDPKHSFAWKALGIIRHNQNNFIDAITAFEQAYQCNHQDYEALQNLGKLYFLQQNYAKAEHYFQLLNSINPYDQSAIDNLIECLCSRGAFNKSLTYIRASLQDRLDGHLPFTTKPIAPAFDHPQNEQLLWTTLAALAGAGIHAFPTAGTLLGLAREGKLLSFDKDLDVGLPYAEMEQACAFLSQHGWSEHQSYIQLNNPRSLTHAQSGMVIDLCGFALEEKSNMVVCGFWHAHLPWDQQRVTVFPNNFKLQQAQSKAGMVWEIAYQDDFLTALYGDWRTPDPDFDTICCAKNLRAYTDMVKVYTLNRLRQTWSLSQFKKALRLANQHLIFCPEDELIQEVKHKLENHFLAA
jgi:tetratricopeptide (TPR) repeat protein